MWYFNLEGIWSPLALLLVIALTSLVAYLLYMMGNASYTKTKYKGQPFISGNPPPTDVRKIHVGGDNLFWGFTKALEKYFDRIVKGHTGVINDYVYWVVMALAGTLVFMMIGEISQIIFFFIFALAVILFFVYLSLEDGR